MKTQITTRTATREKLIIYIRLDDPCGNGHDDFSLTADLYDGRRLDSCGMMHDEILKVKPFLKLFAELHGSDENGMPMHAVENGYKI